jgi:hypothetical protein
MNATPFLGALLDALTAEKLEAVLIGNAAAAVLGAPVTTLDFDFMFRDTVTPWRTWRSSSGSPSASTP